MLQRALPQINDSDGGGDWWKLWIDDIIGDRCGQGGAGTI